MADHRKTPEELPPPFLVGRESRWPSERQSEGELPSITQFLYSGTGPRATGTPPGAAPAAAPAAAPVAAPAASPTAPLAAPLAAPAAEPAAPGLPAVPPLPGYRPTGTTPPSAEPWSSGEWRRYDWGSAAALAPDERQRAESAWSDLDWDQETRGRARSRSEIVASVLERIADRIRAGELRVSGQPGMSEEAAIAAALAALLAQRR